MWQFFLLSAYCVQVLALILKQQDFFLQLRLFVMKEIKPTRTKRSKNTSSRDAMYYYSRKYRTRTIMV